MVDVLDYSIFTATELFIGIDVNTLGFVSKHYLKPFFSVYPNTYAEYKKCTMNGTAKLGDILFSYDGNKVIICIFTQGSVGYGLNARHISYDALDISLRRIASNFDVNNYGLALPFNFGVADGGGDIEIIKCIFDTVLTNANITFYK